MATNNQPLPGFTATINRNMRDSAANCFVVHGNVCDKVSNTETVETACTRMASMRGIDIIVWYSPARGITFPHVRHMANAMVATGMLDAEDIGKFACTCPDGQIGVCSGCESRAVAERIWKSMFQPEAAMDVLLSMWQTSAIRQTTGTEPKRMSVAIFVTHAEKIFSEESEHGGGTFADRRNVAILRDMALSVDAMNRGNMLALITEERAKIISEIRRVSSRFQTIEVRMPNPQERAEYFEHMASQHGIVLSDTVEHLAHASAGLSRYNIETVCLHARIHGIPLNAALVSNEKQRIVTEAFNGCLTILNTAVRLSDIGGMPNVKDAVQRMLIGPFLAGTFDVMASGVLFVGPAGTGKTMISGAIGNEINVSVVIFDFGKMKGKYVGESEAKIEAAIALCEALAPVIVFVDEIDQCLRRGEKDSHSVDSHAFQTFTIWTAREENVGRILLVGASNRPDLLDPASLRAGRFDTILLVDMPEENDRREIARLRLGKFAEYFSGMDLDAIAERIAVATVGMSGAEINLTVKELAGEISRGESVENALEYLLRYAGSTTQAVVSMREASLNVCTPRFIPDHLRATRKAIMSAPIPETSERIVRGEN